MGVESHESQHRTWISKCYPLEIFLKISYNRPPKRTVCFVEIVVFAWRYPWFVLLRCDVQAGRAGSEIWSSTSGMASMGLSTALFEHDPSCGGCYEGDLHRRCGPQLPLPHHRSLPEDCSLEGRRHAHPVPPVCSILACIIRCYLSLLCTES